MLDLFERLMDLAAEEKRPERKKAIEQLAWEKVEEADPVRVLHARQLLGVSDHTIAEWVSRGVLDERTKSPRRVSLESVLKAKQAVDELRELGQNRDLLSAVLSRLEAQDLAEDDRFQRSLAQMRRGERGEWPRDF